MRDIEGLLKCFLRGCLGGRITLAICFPSLQSGIDGRVALCDRRRHCLAMIRKGFILGIAKRLMGRFDVRGARVGRPFDFFLAFRYGVFHAIAFFSFSQSRKGSVCHFFILIEGLISAFDI